MRGTQRGGALPLPRADARGPHPAGVDQAVRAAGSFEDDLARLIKTAAKVRAAPGAAGELALRDRTCAARAVGPGSIAGPMQAGDAPAQAAEEASSPQPLEPAARPPARATEQPALAPSVMNVAGAEVEPGPAARPDWAPPARSEAAAPAAGSRGAAPAAASEAPAPERSAGAPRVDPAAPHAGAVAIALHPTAPSAPARPAASAAHTEAIARTGSARARRDEHEPRSEATRLDTVPPASLGPAPRPAPAGVHAPVMPARLASDAPERTERAPQDPARAREAAKRGEASGREQELDGRAATASPAAPPPPLGTAAVPPEPRAEPVRTRPMAPPLPSLPVEAGEAAVSGAVLPAAAHLHVSSETLGEVALHLRIQDGAAHVRVEGGSRAALEARAPELVRALAAEGLGLARLEHEPRSPQSGGGGAGASAGDPARDGSGGSRDASERQDEHGGGAPPRPASGQAPRASSRAARKHGGTHDVTA